jgi:hypothetical protein
MIKKTLEKINVHALITASRSADGTVIFDISYNLKLNDQVMADKQFSLESSAGAGEKTEVDEQVIYEDSYHYYFVKYHYTNSSIQLNLESAFIEYKK